MTKESYLQMCRDHLVILKNYERKFELLRDSIPSDKIADHVDIIRGIQEIELNIIRVAGFDDSVPKSWLDWPEDFFNWVRRRLWAS